MVCNAEKMTRGATREVRLLEGGRAHGQQPPTRYPYGSNYESTVARHRAMTGTLACVECRRPGALDSEVVVLTCGCGGSLRFVPGHTPTVVDSITVPGAPALVADLIDRFRSGDRVVVEDAIAGYHRDAAATRSDVEERLQLFVTSSGGSLAGLEYAIKQIESIRRK